MPASPAPGDAEPSVLAARTAGRSRRRVTCLPYNESISSGPRSRSRSKLLAPKPYPPEPHRSGDTGISHRYLSLDDRPSNKARHISICVDHPSSCRHERMSSSVSCTPPHVRCCHAAHAGRRPSPGSRAMNMRAAAGPRGSSSSSSGIRLSQVLRRIRTLLLPALEALIGQRLALSTSSCPV